MGYDPIINPTLIQIDYVRVYQNPQDDAQIVGCSTPTHPTSTFIKGWADNYKSDGDEKPLQAVATGGHACVGDGGCGHGACVKLHCRCDEGYTGPTCLATEAFDDDVWEPEAPLTLAGTVPPPPPHTHTHTRTHTHTHTHTQVMAASNVDLRKPLKVVFSGEEVRSVCPAWTTRTQRPARSHPGTPTPPLSTSPRRRCALIGPPGNAPATPVSTHIQARQREQGIDEGGVRKEFFQLLMSQVRLDAPSTLSSRLTNPVSLLLAAHVAGARSRRLKRHTHTRTQ